MKLSKIVSKTVSRSIGLMIFAGLFMSCQKNQFSNKGLVTKWEMPSRGIASVKTTSNAKDRFINFQDPKQILIFCELNSAKVKICYKNHFEKVVTKFKTNNSHITELKLADIRTRFSYENTKTSLEAIMNDVKFQTSTRLNKLVEARKSFCAKNAEYFLEKCLTQYMEKDTFSVLNQFHGKHKMNGHEYLYLKKIIKNNFEAKLNEAHQKIQKTKTSI